MPPPPPAGGSSASRLITRGRRDQARATGPTAAIACSPRTEPELPFGRAVYDVRGIDTSRPERRLRARSARTVSVTYCDGSPRPGLGCHGTTRGTSAKRIPVRCVLSVRSRVASVQVERSWRPSSPLLIRGFWVRAPGAPPAKTLLVDLVSVGRVTRPTNTAYLPASEAFRSRKVTASPHILLSCQSAIDIATPSIWLRDPAHDPRDTPRPRRSTATRKRDPSQPERSGCVAGPLTGNGWDRVCPCVGELRGRRRCAPCPHR